MLELRVRRRGWFLGLALLLPVCLPGCKDAGGRLVGTWEIDKEALVKAEHADATTRFLVSLDSLAVVFDFRADGTLQTSTRLGPVEKEGTGAWKVLEAKEDELRVEITLETEGQAATHEGKVVFEGDDSIRIRADGALAGDLLTLVLKRKE